MKKGFVLILTLVMLLACTTALATDATLEGGVAPAASMELPNGLDWDAALIDVCEAEGIADAAEFILSETDTMQEYWIPSAGEAPPIVGTYYVFRNDALACVGIDHFPSDPEGDASLLTDLEAMYGAPTASDPGAVIDMFNAYKESFPPEILLSVNSWVFNDGTMIHYVDISAERYVFYANTAVLYDNAD